MMTSLTKTEYQLAELSAWFDYQRRRINLMFQQIVALNWPDGVITEAEVYEAAQSTMQAFPMRPFRFRGVTIHDDSVEAFVWKWIDLEWLDQFESLDTTNLYLKLEAAQTSKIRSRVQQQETVKKQRSKPGARNPFTDWLRFIKDAEGNPRIIEPPAFVAPPIRDSADGRERLLKAVKSKLEAHLKLNGLTQQQFLEDAGLNRPVLRRLLEGKAQIATYKKLANALRVPLEAVYSPSMFA